MSQGHFFKEKEEEEKKEKTRAMDTHKMSTSMSEKDAGLLDSKKAMLSENYRTKNLQI